MLSKIRKGRKFGNQKRYVLTKEEQDDLLRKIEIIRAKGLVVNYDNNKNA